MSERFEEIREEVLKWPNSFYEQGCFKEGFKKGFKKGIEIAKTKIEQNVCVLQHLGMSTA
ncbi:hypothetical protein M3N64_10145 [Sporolactobacillus sp. CPB3-1]|uniref:Transposase n=1 Tax=Sporolactobacillus mangiferae TaxID=2940498 RepID=A0ABT0MBQ5_9BACL|nr:hypothetical protein [Sporolactobacillus mangiferae]MCL1632298.1 hypothetical protein [Sporolactobacillus mangiferae]